MQHRPLSSHALQLHQVELSACTLLASPQVPHNPQHLRALKARALVPPSLPLRRAVALPPPCNWVARTPAPNRLYCNSPASIFSTCNSKRRFRVTHDPAFSVFGRYPTHCVMPLYSVDPSLLPSLPNTSEKWSARSRFPTPPELPEHDFLAPPASPRGLSPVLESPRTSFQPTPPSDSLRAVSAQASTPATPWHQSPFHFPAPPKHIQSPAQAQKSKKRRSWSARSLPFPGLGEDRVLFPPWELSKSSVSRAPQGSQTSYPSPEPGPRALAYCGGHPGGR